MGISLAVWAFAFSAATTVYSMDQQKKAATKSRRANAQREALNQKRADIASARERAKQIRAARAQRATALAQSQGTEGGEGSGLAGAQANIGGQLASNMGFLQKNQALSTEISNLNISSAESISRSNTRAAQGQSLAGIADSASNVFVEKP